MMDEASSSLQKSPLRQVGDKAFSCVEEISGLGSTKSSDLIPSPSVPLAVPPTPTLVQTTPGSTAAAAAAAAEDTSTFDIVKATQYGIYDRVEFLVESGYDVNEVDSENVTLLHWACINNRTEIGKYLIHRGAKVDAIGGELQSTPLHWATRHGHLSSVVLLIQNGADYSIQDAEGLTPLHLACQSGFMNIVAYLIAKGDDVNSVDAKGMTPLMWSVSRTKSVDPNPPSTQFRSLHIDDRYARRKYAVTLGDLI